MKSFSALIYMLNYCRKFEDVKFNIFEDMTLLSQCILLGHPVLAYIILKRSHQGQTFSNNDRIFWK